ncbi:reverse transcriptase domain-containing protein [Tanacetum coccineum]
MKKLVMALVHASKRLKRYFQAHPFIVITKQPIQQILSRPEVAGRLQKWSIVLGEYAIHYRPRISVKGQILAKFIVERPEQDSLDTLMEMEEELPEPWILFTDGSSCTDGSGARLILTNPEGMEFTYALRFRSENKKADALSKIASTSFTNLSKQVLVKELKEKSTGEVEILAVVEEEGDTWMTPIFKYLKKGTLPADVQKSKAIRRKLWRFTVIDRTLYKKSFLGPWPRCVGPLQSNYVLREIHEGSCSMYAVERANHSLGEGIKARLDERSKNWMEELPHVLWAHRTIINSSNGDTSFLLTYGMKAVIPAKIGMPTLRTAEVDLVQNNEALAINLNLLEERREQAAIQEAKIDTSNLGPKWEGPYEVTEALGKGAYKLRDRDGRQLPQTWNVSNLKKCYVYKM